MEGVVPLIDQPSGHLRAMRRPPAILVFLSFLLLALGATGGALMSVLQPQIRAYASEWIFAAREAHALSGSRDYDADVVSEIVFTVEAGLSFFHTHGEGMGLVLLFAATLVASLARPRWLRAGLHWLLGVSALFPLGYLAYSALILVYGRDRGIALAEQILLIPSGSSAILALAGLAGVVGLFLLNGRLRRVGGEARPSTRPPGFAPAHEGWRRPPRLVVLAAMLLIALAELSGAAMGRFKPEIDGFVDARARERPDVHELVDWADADAETLDEIRIKADAGVRLFHLHGEGVGLMMFAGALGVATYVTARWARRTLHVMLVVGGFVFPFGYLLWSGLIPFLGVDAARTTASLSVLVPSGMLFLFALWALLVPLARAALPRRRGVAGEAPGQPAVGPGERSLRPPPLVLVLAALLLLVLAEVGGGVMTQFKVDLDRARRAQIDGRPLVHGLVGVRQIDGPVVDTLLSRADFALRLFHLHGEGMGLVMIAGGIVVVNFVRSRLLAGVLHVLLTVGGFLYPFGYLAWSLLIPILGLQPARNLAEVFVWAPFGGAVLVALGLTAVVLAGEVLGAAPRSVARVLAPALILLAGIAAPAAAHHVGVVIPRDDDLTRNVKEIRYAAQAGRPALAAKLFDEGIVHATMEKEEKRLPRGLEDGLRAALQRGDLPGSELRLAVVLAFLARERLREARARIERPGLPPDRRRAQARKLVDAAWRYYNLADLVVSAQDAKTGVTLRVGFEDAQTHLGGMMVDPMWAGAAAAKPANPDDGKATAVLDGMTSALGRFMVDAARIARAGGAARFLPRR